MGAIKVGEPFGLDSNKLATLDWDKALSRILQDVRSDFIYAPHISYIFSKGGQALIELVKQDLKSGKYLPSMPITIEVPKSFRMQVKVQSRRLGPSYSRPGSILLPRDRLLYQVIADEAAPIVNAKEDKTRTFSHRLNAENDTQMFVATRICWSNLQAALSEYADSGSVNYILRLDITNCFGSINHHTLINTLSDAGFDKGLCDRLECMLTFYTIEKSSRSLLQGMFPSDLLGNFYMNPIDRLLEESEVPSARYVDDMYIFVESVDAADHLLRSLIPRLRSYDLVLNEAKSAVMPKAALVTEEPDLEQLFEDAVAEIAEQLDQVDYDVDYGFQSEWEDDEEAVQLDHEEALELHATKALFASVSEYPGQEENVERFCLPLFSRIGSQHAVPHVKDAFRKRPAMTQIYAAYLSEFIEDDEISGFLSDLLSEESLTDWQKMWVLAGLLKRKDVADATVKAAWSIAKDATRHEALRAVAALFVGRHGDLDRRKSLVTLYPSVSSYIRLAIYYVSKDWPSAERVNAKTMWSNDGELNRLMTATLASN